MVNVMNNCVISITPYLVVVLDVVLFLFFLTMALRAPLLLRWRLAVFSGVAILSLPIDAARILSPHVEWLGAANACWTCATMYAIAFLAGLGQKTAIPLAAAGLALTGIMFGLDVNPAVISSSVNGALGVSGIVIFGRLYLKTRGFASGNLAAIWALFLLHGTCYHLMAQSGDLTLAYGYMIAVLILWCLAIFGYIYLPRELEGRIPVNLPLAYPVAVIIAGGSLNLAFNALVPGLSDSLHYNWVGILALGAVAGMLIPLIASFIHHRLYLVAYADEVEQRLAERTVETVRQKDLLEQQNELLLRKARELFELATTDFLTGLNNRRMGVKALHDECKRSSRYSGQMSCIMFDIDHFKSVNDTYGHDKGDLVLKFVAGIIRDAIRDTDTVCRFGGEEFLVVCPGVGKTGAAHLAERIRKQVGSSGYDEHIKVTVSGGVASFQPGDDRESLLKRADSSMYDAKKQGRDRIHIG